MRETLAGEPTLAEALMDRPAAPLLAPLVRTALDAHQAVGLDLILEGFLLHYGRPRQLQPADRSAAVLAGDYCYAQGLVRVAGADDLFSIRTLADLIALGANLIAADERELAVLLWRASCAAIAARPGAERDRDGAALGEACHLLRVGELVAGRAALRALAERLPPTPDLIEALR
ncbi:MAG TPA: hypothetical protein PKE32_03255 [Miltoncostaeaceae bacterium]|nr:hypothetical protein [Miltoncostaeaceae bacterium]